MKAKIISWTMRILIAIILGQTLFFKFSDAPETIELFAKLNAGAAMYKTIGALELVACILILIPLTVIYGALLVAGLMSGAIMAHLTIIGFSGPDGSLALMAVVAWFGSVITLLIHRKELPIIGSKLQ